VNKD